MSATEQAAAATAKAMKDVQGVADAEAETFKVLTDQLLKMKKAEDSTKTSKREMKTIIDNLNRNYGQYLGNLDLERASYDQIAAAATKAANAIASKKLAEGFGNLAAEQAKKVAELRLQYDKLRQDTLTKNYFDTLRGQEGGGQGGGADFGDALVKRNNQNLASLKTSLDAAEAELKRIVKAYTDAMTAADLFAEGDKTPGAAGSGIGAIGERVMSAYEKQIALAREMVANVKLLGLTEQQYTDQRNILLEDSLAQYQKYGMAEEQINAIRIRSQELFVEEYKDAMGIVAEAAEEAADTILVSWESHVGAMLDVVKELGATYDEFAKWRGNQIETEIMALRDLGVDSELLNQLLERRLGLLGQEYEAYQKLRDEGLMDAWIDQHELQYDLLSNTVDIVTEGFATMIREGKTFGETMSDIWQNWVDMAIEEVQRLIARLITAWIIKQLITAVSGGTGGAADVVGLVAGAKSFGSTGAGGLIMGGGGSEVSLLVNELRQMRRELLGGLTAPMTMNWRKGEMHRAVAADGLYRQVI